MGNLVDILNPTGAQQTVKVSEVYRPSFKEAKNGVYKAVIRFVPNPRNTDVCVAEKYVSWVKNPVTQIKKVVDNPSKESGQRSPITEMYFRLYNTGVESYKEIAKDLLSSKLQYASIVQILQDEQHPEYVGTFKIFVYGKKLWEKIHYEEFPPAGTGVNPFHPIYGRRFSLICQSQSGFNNFDQSCFYDEKNGNTISPSGLWYVNPTTQQMEVVDENIDAQVLTSYLVENCPDLSKYEPQPWTEEQENHVRETLLCIENFLNTGSYSSAQQIAQQRALNTLNGIPTAAPQFPGATQAPVQPTAPKFPGATVPPTAVPQFPGATQVPVQPTAPVNVSPVTGNHSSVSGVDLPNVSPRVNGGTEQSGGLGSGINVDDILNQL